MLHIKDKYADFREMTAKKMVSNIFQKYTYEISICNKKIPFFTWFLGTILVHWTVNITIPWTSGTLVNGRVVIWVDPRSGRIMWDTWLLGIDMSENPSKSNYFCCSVWIIQGNIVPIYFTSASSLSGNQGCCRRFWAKCRPLSLWYVGGGEWCFKGTNFSD